MKNPWTTELWRVIGIAAISLIIGGLFGQAVLLLLIAVIGYLSWHLYHVYQLYRWITHTGRFQPPEGSGVWREIFDQLYRLQKRNRARKKKLTKFLNRFQESTAAMPDGTVVLDKEWQIEWMNSAAHKMLRLNPQKDIGQHVVNLIRHPAFQAYIQQGNFRKALEMTQPGDENKHLSVRIVPYGQNQRLLVARDVTLIKQLEQIRRDFIANISHELRTPLTVLNGYLETMIDDTDHNSGLHEWKPSLKLMHQQTSRMSNIVNDLLMLSRLETTPPLSGGNEVSVPAMLTTIRDDAIALSGDRNHDIQLEIDHGIWLNGINNELHSSFSNLVFNAVRYTPNEGKIIVRWYKDDAGAHFEVQDSGIGIPPQHIPRLTERFYRVDIGRSRDVGGTGLGLAIVKHVLQRHNAELRIKSTVNKGSTFTCDFPTKRVILSPLQNHKENKQILQS